MSEGRTGVVDFAAARRRRGLVAETRGRDAESLAASALSADGWVVLARRLRTIVGEIDLVAERDGVVAFVEVKARSSLAEAAFALDVRQRRRLVRAAEVALADHAGWGRAGVRFDVVLVDAVGRVRRVANAFDAQAA